jgi:TRAP-type C4-dicarboxylate transport system substrate-binding protein
MKHNRIARALAGTLVAAALALASAAPASAGESIKLRIAAGHSPAIVYVHLMQNFFVPEVTKRVAARTKHRVEFIEGYGGAMVKVADTLEGVRTGIIDIGGFCFCFEPSNLPLHAFQVMLPFGPMDPVMSLQVARTVFDKVPWMSEVFEKRFNQKLINIFADTGYHLGTNFEWKSLADLKGRRIAGAGLNLNWLESTGATPVQTTLPEAYHAMKTGVYDGLIMFPSAWISFKLFEVGRFYTQVDLGAISWFGLTINRKRWAKLPPEVQAIILEVGREMEILSGTMNRENYPKQLEQLRQLGTTVRRVPDSVIVDWANSLKGWPQQIAAELDKQGMPASQVLQLALEHAEKLGHKWPVRYRIK